MKDDRLYLLHIVERIDRNGSAGAAGREAFLKDVSIQDAVIRNLEFIGEAAKRISKPLMDQNPQVPWRMLARLRDLLIHHYERVIVTEIWKIIEMDLPQVKNSIQAVIHRLEQPQ